MKVASLYSSLYIVWVSAKASWVTLDIDMTLKLIIVMKIKVYLYK